MFSYNLTYELKLLWRSRWIQLLGVLLLVLIGFAVYNGQVKTNQWENSIQTAKQTLKASDAAMVKVLDSVEQGLEVSLAPWLVPTSPMAVGNVHPRVVAKDAQPLSYIATGQSDLFTPYVSPKATGDDFAIEFTEMTSPVQLLFGNFDLAFVIIYLLPLLIIAFSYHVLSAEKERGSLRILMAQPISIRQWVFQKLTLRFLVLSVLVVVAFVVVALGFGLDVWANAPSFLILIALVLTYMLFWFALVFLVNLWVGQSARNAISLLGLWIFFVLLVPSILNQMGSVLYPMPSRTQMIGQMRSLKAEATEKQDEILDNFLRDHPEYAVNDSTQKRNFYHRYVASQQLIRSELEPVVNRYTEQLQKQQDLLGNFKWLSPAIVVQQALNRLAGNSTADFLNYKSQVMGFSETWRNHLMPFLYNNQDFSQEDVPKLPVFQYQPLSSSAASALPVLLGLVVLLFGLGFGFTKRIWAS
jgi:ABC-2 type transport system permease protein